MEVVGGTVKVSGKAKDKWEQGKRRRRMADSRAAEGSGW